MFYVLKRIIEIRLIINNLIFYGFQNKTFVSVAYYQLKSNLRKYKFIDFIEGIPFLNKLII